MIVMMEKSKNTTTIGSDQGPSKQPTRRYEIG